MINILKKLSSDIPSETQSQHSNFMHNINAFVNMIWSNRCIWFWGIDWIWKKIGCMPEFTCGNLVYLEENDEIPKNHHKNFIVKQEPKFTITSSMIFLEEKLKTWRTMFVKNVIVPWIEEMSKLLHNYQ